MVREVSEAYSRMLFKWHLHSEHSLSDKLACRNGDEATNIPKGPIENEKKTTWDRALSNERSLFSGYLSFP